MKVKPSPYFLLEAGRCIDRVSHGMKHTKLIRTPTNFDVSTATSITKATDCTIIMADQKYTEDLLINRSWKAPIPYRYGAGNTDNPIMITEDIAQWMYMKAFAYRIEESNVMWGLMKKIL
jgi:hypothetical protein